MFEGNMLIFLITTSYKKIKHAGELHNYRVSILHYGFINRITFLRFKQSDVTQGKLLCANNCAVTIKEH